MRSKTITVIPVWYICAELLWSDTNTVSEILVLVMISLFSQKHSQWPPDIVLAFRRAWELVLLILGCLTHPPQWLQTLLTHQVHLWSLYVWRYSLSRDAWFDRKASQIESTVSQLVSLTWKRKHLPWGVIFFPWDDKSDGYLFSAVMILTEKLLCGSWLNSLVQF